MTNQPRILPELIHHLPYCILLLARDRRIVYANHAAEDALGESLAYLGKRNLAEVFHPSEDILALVKTAFDTKQQLVEYDFSLSGHRVGARLVTLHLVPRGEEMLICFDNTNPAQALTHSVSHKQQARAQSTMAAILAHEVKNPLAGIRGAAQLLHKTVKPDDRELTALIRNEADRIKSVVEEMEFFSNPSELKTEPLNIHEVLRYARDVTQKGAGKEVTFIEKFDPSLPLISGHYNLLVQVFINLLKNAIEASEEYVIITLSSAFQSGVRLRVGATPVKKALPILITVQDSGPGIRPELRESIFEPFVTTKQTGKGLGLAIVAKIIADHGGIIELDAQYERGTCFNLLLPAV